MTALVQHSDSLVLALFVVAGILAAFGTLLSAVKGIVELALIAAAVAFVAFGLAAYVGSAH